MIVDSSKHHALFEQFKAAQMAASEAIKAYEEYTKLPTRDPKVEPTLVQHMTSTINKAAELGRKFEDAKLGK